MCKCRGRETGTVVVAVKDPATGAYTFPYGSGGPSYDREKYKGGGPSYDREKYKGGKPLTYDPVAKKTEPAIGTRRDVDKRQLTKRDLLAAEVAGQPAIDAWTAVHAASGAALGVLGVPWFVALPGLVAFEVFEAGLRSSSAAERLGAGGDFGKGLVAPESLANVGADIVAGVGGYLAGRLVR